MLCLYLSSVLSFLLVYLVRVVVTLPVLNLLDLPVSSCLLLPLLIQSHPLSILPQQSEIYLRIQAVPMEEARLLICSHQPLAG